MSKCGAALSYASIKAVDPDSFTSFVESKGVGGIEGAARRYSKMRRGETKREAIDLEQLRAKAGKVLSTCRATEGRGEGVYLLAIHTNVDGSFLPLHLWEAKQGNDVLRLIATELDIEP